MEIIRAGEADWRLVRDVRLRGLEADPSAFGSSLERELAFAEADWRERVRGAAWFLAMPGGPADPPVGVALVRPLEPGAGADFEINAMWVVPELRGQRIGEALLDAALAAAKAAGPGTNADGTGADGAGKIQLRVTNGNDRALALYTRRGFVPTGRTEPLLSDPQLTVAEYVLTLG